MIRHAVLAALLGFSIASGAWAEVQQIAAPQSSLDNPTDADQNKAAPNKPWRQGQRGDAKSAVTPEQLRRAHEAAALIKANRCEDAYNLAVNAQDFRLAGNVAVACKAQFRL